MGLVAYCDDVNEYEWFVGLNPEFASAKFERIRPRGENPDQVDDLIIYDRPDVILIAEDRPVLVLEKTREVPTGHNVGQRMARLVRAVERGVPTFKFFPFDARKHGLHSSVCFMNARILGAFERMWELHETPLLAVNWPADPYGELIDEESADNGLIDLLCGFVESDFDPRCRVISEARLSQIAEYQKRCSDDVRYASPPPSLTIEATKLFLARVDRPAKVALADHLKDFDEVVVYTIKMKERSCRRQDPYTGTQFIYDYLYCRSGPEPSQKFRALILHFPEIRTAVWEENNPDDIVRKSCNWYLTANAHVYSDGYALLR